MIYDRKVVTYKRKRVNIFKSIGINAHDKDSRLKI